MTVRAPVAVDAGVPGGTLAAARAWALRAARGLGGLAGRRVTVDDDALAAHVLLPAVLAARDGGGWARPARPRPAPGGGFLAADLGAPGDEEQFERLLATLPPGADARAVEQAAQEWRIPVVAYRTRRESRAGMASVAARLAAAPVEVCAGAPPRFVPSPGARRPLPGAAPRLEPPLGASGPLAGVRVVDLTAMWAGPLATWLLADLGAEVVKIESGARPDGMRGQPALFAALDAGKAHLDLDLREPPALARLEAVIAHADVVVDSFSPRVMPNLGLAPDRLAELNPRIVAVSLPAFPPGTAQAAWVSYGTGGHAFAGLGDVGGGRFAAPEVTYPDPLAGLAALAAAVEGLAAGGGRRVASIVSALAPLAASAGADTPRSLAEPVEPVAAALAGELAATGRLGAVTVASPLRVEHR